MALQGSGIITLANVQSEFGGSNPISLSEYYRNGPYVTPNNGNVPTGGTISLSQFYGGVKQFSFNINGVYTTGQNLRSLALAAGWNGSDYLDAHNYGILSSNSTSVPALTINGSFPNGVKFTNNNYILGMGGAGGDYMQVGAAGGTSVAVGSYVTIKNNSIFAGGGGGGGAGVYWSWNGYNRSMAGSGGASGVSAAIGGLNPPQLNYRSSSSVDGNGDGIYESGGPSFNWGWGGRLSSPGGIGGSWGTAGDAGGTVDGNYNYSGYAGGAGGAAVTGSGYVSWESTGTRYGAIA
jgi:hypothetical protein